MNKHFNHFRSSTGEIGVVRQVMPGMVSIDGLPKAQLDEMIIFDQGQLGYVFGLEEEYVQAVVLTTPLPQAGAQATRTSWRLSIAIDDTVLGQQVGMLGQFDPDMLIDLSPKLQPIDVEPRSVGERVTIEESLQTDIMLIDSLIPLGRGQRELFIGDRGSGKTSTAQQIVRSAARDGVICIYCLVGKRSQEIVRVNKALLESPEKDNIVVVATSAHDTLGQIVMVPFTAMTIAEHFANQGKNALVVFDDLTMHAKFYRELSLLTGRFPGRESYPGDVFYLHARLMERAGKFRNQSGTVSITALPLAHSPAGNMAGFIQTNLMGITDGHLYFDLDMFYANQRPAISPFLSVTRVGRQTQTKARQTLSQKAMDMLHRYEKAKEFSQFGADLAGQVAIDINNGQRFWELLRQAPDFNLSYDLQTLVVSLIAFTQLSVLEIKLLVKKYQDSPGFAETVATLNNAKNADELKAAVLALIETYRNQGSDYFDQEAGKSGQSG